MVRKLRPTWTISSFVVPTTVHRATKRADCIRSRAADEIEIRLRNISDQVSTPVSLGPCHRLRPSFRLIHVVTVNPSRQNQRSRW